MNRSAGEAGPKPLRWSFRSFWTPIGTASTLHSLFHRVPHKAGEFPPAEACLINHPLILAPCARSSAPDRYPFLAHNFFSFPAVSSLVAILIKKSCIALRIYQNVCQIVALCFMLSCNSDILERVNAPNKIKILLLCNPSKGGPIFDGWDTRHALPVVQHGSASSWIGNRARRVIDRLSPLYTDASFLNTEHDYHHPFTSCLEAISFCHHCP